MKRIQLGLVLGVVLCLPTLSWAFSLGELADNIYAPTAFVTKFVIFGCYAVGVALALAGIMQYKNHQQNAKLVPLSIPITLFVLSAILLLLPFASKQGGASWSAAEKTKQEEKYIPNNTPFSTGTDSQAPAAAPAEGSSTDNTNASPAEEESGHWSTKH